MGEPASVVSGRSTRAIAIEDVRPLLARHLPIYNSRPPVYQTVMLQRLAAVWEGHRAVLDVGAGVGVIGQAVSELFDCAVTGVDVADRFAEGLSITTRTYDGVTLPFEDDTFDAAMLNNVLHHVPLDARDGLLREIRRVCRGPLYVKDHASGGVLDDLRLAALDAIGNIPFGGMVWASYIAADGWARHAQAAGYAIETREGGDYRSGLMAGLFPNRLEVTMRWRPQPG